MFTIRQHNLALLVGNLLAQHGPHIILFVTQGELTSMNVPLTVLPVDFEIFVNGSLSSLGNLESPHE